LIIGERRAFRNVVGGGVGRVVPTVVVADARFEVRGRRANAFRSAGWHVLGEAPDVRTARELVRQTHPQVLVLDSWLPGGGVELVRDVRDGALADCVVVGRRRCACEPLAYAVAGAAGFVLEDESSERLVAAAESVARGEASLPPGLVRELVEDVRRREHEETLHRCAPLSALTPRQWEVLAMMRQGLTTQQMARRLVVAPVTVRSHVAGILHVLGARDRVEALEKVDELLARSPHNGDGRSPAGTPTFLPYVVGR
jgi:DNA-binding NarL/FixJ family response regulator